MGQHYTQMIINTKTTSADDILTLWIDLYHCRLFFCAASSKLVLSSGPNNKSRKPPVGKQTENEERRTSELGAVGADWGKTNGGQCLPLFSWGTASGLKWSWGGGVILYERDGGVLELPKKTKYVGEVKTGLSSSASLQLKVSARIKYEEKQLLQLYYFIWHLAMVRFQSS